MSEAAKALRKRVSRTSFGRWKPSDTRDPFAVLAAQEATRAPALVSVRRERMAHDPFSFYRGAAAIMAADLAALPVTGLRAQLCGDAHVMNFGAYASPERRLVFDVNDFDETLPGPWEWDVMRLCASLQVAGALRGFRKDRCDDAVFAAGRAYRIAMRGFAEMAPLDVWYSSIDVEHLLQSELTMAQTAQSLVPKMCVNDSGALRFADHPPFFVRLDPTDQRALNAHKGVRAYRASLPVHIRTLLDRYHVVDIAEKVVGIGSVGLTALVALLLADDRQPLVLQIKEARASVLEPFAGASSYVDHGERVVVGQRLMQAATDIFLGYAQVDGTCVYVRQLRDMKAALALDTVDASKLIDYAGHCGEVLARGHARSGEPAAIGGYLGRAANFEESMVEFSHAYARINERDHDAFVRKI